MSAEDAGRGRLALVLVAVALLGTATAIGAAGGPAPVLPGASLVAAALVLAASAGSRTPLGPRAAAAVAGLALLAHPLVAALVVRPPFLEPIVLAAPLLAAAALALALRASDDGVRGLALLAIAASVAVVDRHLLVASRGLAPDDVAALACAGVAAGAAVGPARPPRWALSLSIALAIAAYALAGIALIAGTPYHSDGVVAQHRAAELLIAGRHPYATFDMIEALGRFGLPASLATNFEDGSVLRSLNYPALAFLVPAPFVALGLHDLRWLWLAEILGFALLISVVLVGDRRAWGVAALVASTAVARQFVAAGVDPTWALMTAVAFAFIDRPAVSPLAMGIAIASRQPAWAIAPFFALALWRRSGRVAASRGVALMAAAALAPQLPFLVLDPVATLTGIAAPIVGPLEAHGIGLVGLALAGALPILPRGVYAALAMGAAAAGAWVATRRGGPSPAMAIALPLAALLLAWRALLSYVAFLPVLALVTLARETEVSRGRR